MTLSSHKEDVGVIIGRFQVHELHEAHRLLIETIRKQHDKVIIFIGLSPLRGTVSNPLDFNTRKRMIQEKYADIDVYYVEDNRSDETWSKNLDREIQRWTKPHQTVVLYGSRDSFIPHYSGKYSVQELESTLYISGTEIRRRIANNFPPTREYRAGMIAQTFNRYPVVYTTVDVAIIDHNHPTKRILLGKKRNENEYRFIGGFSSPDSVSFEEDVRRETSEETGVEIDDIRYIGSVVVDDWRYRKEIDKIKTLFFVASYTFGRPEGADDIELTTWVSLSDLLNGTVPIVTEHKPLVQMLSKQFPNTSAANSTI